jgi:hypothetical protein
MPAGRDFIRKPGVWRIVLVFSGLFTLVWISFLAYLFVRLILRTF